MSRALLLSPLFVVACLGSGEGSSEVCPRTAAAFELRLSATSGELPRDTELRVTFGGATTESYSLRGGNDGNQVVCCVPGDGEGVSLAPATCGAPRESDASAVVTAPGVAAESIRCQLWTNGAAEVLAEGGEYLPIERTLVAREDVRHPECAAWETQQIELRFGLEDDAGAGPSR